MLSFARSVWIIILQVWGDARVVGGSKSTAVTISPIDHSLVLSDTSLKLHSPLLAVSVCVYSGGDNRISLQANIGGWLNKFIAEGP